MTTASAPSWAWKPYTHVYLAQQAYQDAVDDGRVTLYKVDTTTGQPVRDGAGRPIVLGTYAVQPRILQALRASPAKYFAGVLGPDAYPDILTGQMRIHPPGAHDGNLPDNDADGPGTDAWLQQIWAKAWQAPFGNDDSIAFATGFLAHAAGDIYAHTFMNTYAGGIFNIRDMTNLNWFKHITVEGYVGERTPDLGLLMLPGATTNPNVFDIVRLNGITGLEGFIANNTWDVHGPNGMPEFPTEGGKNYSVPYHLAKFLETVTRVNQDVRAFDARLFHDFSHASFNASPLGAARELVWACGGNDCPDTTFTSSACPGEYPRGGGVCVGMGFGGILGWSAAWGMLATAYGTAYLTARGPVTAIEGWTGNAMTTTPIAMRDWVSASHNTAIHLFFTPDHLVHMDSNEFPGTPTLAAGYAPFKIDMESIATGLPRGAVMTINQLIDFIMSPLTALQHAIGDAERWVIDQVFQNMFHMTTDQAKECFAKPHLWMNPLLRNNTSGLSGTIASLNSIMHVPTITPASCTGPNTLCTISPGLVGTDITGACDIFTGGTVAKFSVDPASPYGVFPAAFNSVNMIKLSMIDPAQIDAMATTLAGRSLGPIFPVMGGAPSPANAMIGFAATIDGSHEWMARRNGAFFDAGQSQMILARDCKAYWSVFLDQRPNYNAQGVRLTGAALDLVKPNLIDPLWEPEPMGPCMMKPPIHRLPPNLVTHLNDTLATAGFAQVTASEPSLFSLASSGKNRHDSAITQGSLVVAADGLSARYVAPKWNPYGQDQIVVTSKDGARRSVVPVNLEPPRQAGLRRDLTKTAIPGKSGDPTGLRAGETAQLLPVGKLPMTWTVVSGPGTVGDPKQEALHDAKLTVSKGKLATSDQQLLAHSPKLVDARCKGPCQTQAVETVKVATRARTAAVLDVAQTKRQLDDTRATYHAPSNLTKDETVTLRGVDAEGNTSLVNVRLLAPPAALQAKLAATTVAPGANMKLDVDAGLPAGKTGAPPIPMTWVVVSGPGTVGDKMSKEHAFHHAKKQEFLGGLEPLSKQLANAQPFEIAAAKAAWLEYMQSNLPKYAPSFEKLDELERTYHAPAKVVGRQKVTLRGTAQDGSGRTVDTTLEIGQ